MIKLDQRPGNYYLRFATYPNGDMQQVLEGQAIVSYIVSDPCTFFINIDTLRRLTEMMSLHRTSPSTLRLFGC